MTAAVARPRYRTLAEFLKRTGDVPLERIRFDPAPGTATIQDVADILDREGRSCDLIHGVLVEKTVGYRESTLAMFIGHLLSAFVLPHNLGLVSGSDGTVELFPALVRVPDVAFISWNRLPEGEQPSSPVPAIVPELVLEVLSQSNTLAEMRIKRGEYLSAGLVLIWEVDPDSRTVSVSTAEQASPSVLSIGEVLEGGDVLPGFSVSLKELFAQLDRKRPA